jgi:hypothetical protein
MLSRMPAAAGRSESRSSLRGARAWWLLTCLILAVIAASVWAAASIAAHDSEIVQPASCPPRAVSPVPKNDWATARRELAPKGATALRLCGYSGINSATALRLTRSRLVTDKKLVTHLVDEFDALPPYPKGAVFACPSDDGSQVLALLGYPHGQRVIVAVDETGCQVVTNGDVMRLANGYANTPVGPRLVAQLKDLTAPVGGDAHVTGLIRLCGGPAVNGHAPTRCFSQDGTVTVLDPRNDIVATQKTSHGRFSFSLPAGTYTLVARTGGARGQRLVVAKAHQTLRVNVVIAIR